MTTMASVRELEECVAVDETGTALETGESIGRGGRRGTRGGIPFSPKIGWEWFSQQLGKGSFSSKRPTSKMDCPLEEGKAQEKSTE